MNSIIDNSDSFETFEMVGHIGTHAEGVGILLLESWHEAYRTKPQLEHTPPATCRDPQTGEYRPLERPVEQRAVKTGDQWVAAFEWNSMADESNQTGIVCLRCTEDAKSDMVLLAKEIAAQLETDFIEIG